MAVAAAVVSIVSAVASYAGQKQQQRQAKRQYESAEKERLAAEETMKKEVMMDMSIKSVERVRNIRRAVAEQRVQQATALQSGYTNGGMSSSGYTAASAATTDQASAVGASNTGFAGSVAMSTLQTQYNQHVSNMQSILNKPIGSNALMDFGGLLGSFSSVMSSEGGSALGAKMGWN